MAALVLYTLATCGTCRRARQWLRARGQAWVERPIRTAPPSPTELRRLLAALDGRRARLCNTAGADYRALGLGGRRDALTTEAFVALLAGNGNLIKRPCLLGPGVALAGFDAEAWSRALPSP